MKIRNFPMFTLAVVLLGVGVTACVTEKQELAKLSAQAKVSRADAEKTALTKAPNGTVTIAHEDAPDKLTVVQTLKTARGARTMTIDPKTHRIYLGAAEYEPSTDPSQRRPKMVAGSFKILVYGTEQ